MVFSPEKHILMTTDAIGGTWVYSTTLAGALTRRGWRVSIVTLGPAPAEDQFLPCLSDPLIDLEITDLDLEWHDPSGEDQARAADHLGEIGRRLAPDIVHLNGYREALAEWRAPVLVAAQSCWGSRHQACRGGEPREADWSHYKKQVAAGLDAAECWVAPSRALRDRIEALYKPGGRGEVVWHGLDMVSAEKPKEPFILAAGRPRDEAKNVAILSRVAERVEWPIRIGGALWHGGEVYDTSPRGSVDWLGNLIRDDLLAMMGSAGIFVAPSLYEPFGLTVLEAAASGCALVLADIPAFRELWAGAAMFVDPTSAPAIQETLNFLCANDEARQSLQQAARRRAARYSVKAMADGYEQLYLRMLGSRNKRTPIGIPALEPAA